MSTEDMIQNLQDAGCSPDAITGFMHCIEAGDTKKGLKMLEQKRRALLDGIHEGHRKLDCLDYLVYQMSRQSD